jgi:predicted dienelactone hydrolase
MPTPSPGHRVRRVPATLLALALAWPACSDDDGGGGDGEAGIAYGKPDYTARGPFPVGNRTLTMVDASRSRALRVEIWYPAVASAAARTAVGEPIEEMVPAGVAREAFVALLAGAVTECTNARTRSAREAAPYAAAAPWPLVLFSHCHNCARFSSLSIAEHLASHGFAVAAVDHADNTLMDKLAGKGVPLGVGFLPTRVADIRFLLDRLLDPKAPELPAALRGGFDAKRVGLFGHSFGSMTTGAVVALDSRFKAAAGLAAPWETPLLPEPTMKQIAIPAFFLVAVEDNSIPEELGNALIRENFAAATPPAWKLEVKDAGHLSVSDLCGLDAGFMPGCGQDTRQTAPGVPFSYIPAAQGRAIAAAWVTAFFGANLRGDAEGKAFLAEPWPAGQVAVESRL